MHKNILDTLIMVENFCTQNTLNFYQGVNAMKSLLVLLRLRDIDFEEGRVFKQVGFMQGMFFKLINSLESISISPARLVDLKTITDIVYVVSLVELKSKGKKVKEIDEGKWSADYISKLTSRVKAKESKEFFEAFEKILRKN